MAQTQNLQLNTYGDSAADGATKFSEWRSKVAGTGSDSNMQKIDAAYGTLNAKIDTQIGNVGTQINNVSKDVGELKSALNSLERKYQTWNFNLTSDSYATEITDIYVNTGDILDIEVTQQSNANIAVYGDSHNTGIGAVGNVVFTAQANGYIRFYYKSVHCKIKFRNNVIVSELGNSTELIASQKLVNDLATDIDNATGYKSAQLTTGYYLMGSTVGGTVKRSSPINNWDYSATPLFVKSGKIVHCTTRANGMCCIAKSQSPTWTDNVPIAVAIADDNVNAKEYTVIAVEDAYYWFSGRTGETTAYIENNDSDEIIVVDVNGGGNYTSLTACLTALKGNTKNKTIYIKEGTYNIFSELGGAEYIASITNPGSKNWRDVQPVVPRNTKIIGQGNVKLTFLPAGSVIGSNDMAFLFSPLNIDSDCEIENISIDCTNCRYALHIESSSIASYNDSILKFKNVRCKKTKGTYGTQYVCATGIGARQKWEFDSCSFEGDLDICWSVHVNNTVANDMAVVIMNNCVFVCTASNPETKNTIRFVSNNNSPVLQNIAKLNNCYTNGKVFLENNNTKQQWDVTLLGCEYAGTGQSTQIVDNPYPIKEY